MKTLITTLALVFSLGLMAQEVVVASYMEQTKVGSKAGLAVGYTFPYGITVGGFYQEIPAIIASDEVDTYYCERNFTGAYFGVPISERRLVDMAFNVRMGVSNGENFLITPSIWSYMKPVKVVNIGLGVGVRAFRPTLQASLNLKLGKS